jgi:hypothetical protein
MATKKPNFAVDKTPEGVNLWQRGRSGDWIGLGYFKSSDADDADISGQIEHAHTEAVLSTDTSCEVRISPSDVFIAHIPASDVPSRITKEAVLASVADRLPFTPDLRLLTMDICTRGSGRLSVAFALTETLKSASAFATSHGFAPVYFTTVVDPMQFPREPRFHLSEALNSLPALKNSTNRTLKYATAAGVALCLIGLALIQTAAVAPPEVEALIAQPVPVVPVVRTVSETVGPKDEVAPAVEPTKEPALVALPDKAEDIATADATPALQVPRISLPDSVENAPNILSSPRTMARSKQDAQTPSKLAGLLVAPKYQGQSLPSEAIEFELAEGDYRPKQPMELPSARQSLFQRTNNSTIGTSGSTLEFSRGGLTTRTKTLLDNSVISIEEPNGVGRKTIRILPFESEEGSLIPRFDPETFVLVAQASSANDAGPGFFPAASIIHFSAGATLRETTEAGTPVFTGAPAVTPPARAATLSEPSQPADGTEAETLVAETGETPLVAGPDSSPVDMAEFTTEIENVLEQSPSGDALVATANAAIDAAEEAASEPDQTEPPTPAPTVITSKINTPDASTVRPKPRPGSVDTFANTALSSSVPIPSTGPTRRQKIHLANTNTPRPKSRPIGMDRAAEARVVEQAVAAAIAAGTGTSQAVFISRIPKARPTHIGQLVERTKASLTLSALGPNAVVRNAPKGVENGSNELSTSKTSKSVAALATERGRLSKSSMNLIGVYGSASSRRALVRMGSGRYVKVKLGDKVGGWKVSAIGESSIRINKGSRNQVLRMPE